MIFQLHTIPKKLLISFVFIGLILATSTTFAQKAFEGTITYAIEYDDLPEEMEAMKGMLPTETTVKIKGVKTKTIQDMVGMGKTISIFDSKTNTTTVLMDMMNNKAAIKTKVNDETKEGEEPTITYSDDTKTIAGYTCKKAEITINKDSEESLMVYYTEEIKAPSSTPNHKTLKGFPMYYEVSTPEMTIVMTVKAVIKEKIADSEFVIPKDYEVMTMEEFQTKMRSQMMPK